MSRGRRFAFWSIVFLTPVLLLLLVEFFLRAIGFGAPLEPLFIANPQRPEFLQANPRVITRFFSDPTDAPAVTIETAYFLADKPAGSFRVFVQGASTAAGFPYGLGASLAGILDQRLERSFPEREIEVISTAMSAVNSYALLDFADEIIAEQPDAVLVYIGHNEFLGILGVGSSLRMAGSPWMTRVFLGVRDWRLFQVMSRIYRRLGEPDSDRAGGQPDTLMARVAGERSIGLDSEVYRRGLAQFERNLDDLLKKYRAAGIPVFIGTVASNERDQPPLAALAGSDAGAGGAALTAFNAARNAEDAENYEAAREGFAWARDLDPLRFRAPSAFNEIIAGLASETGAHLVPSHATLVAASPHGLIGSTLMLEHVHPNLDGYFLLADTFLEALLAHAPPGPAPTRITRADARAEMPVSEVDRWLGEYKTLRIKAAWPFTPLSAAPAIPVPQSEGERLAQDLYYARTTWPEAQQTLREHYRRSGDETEYTRVTGILADAFPFTGALQFQMAAALIRRDRPADALRYARRAVELEPDDVNHLLVMAHAQILSGRREAGRATLEKVLAIAPDNPTARSVLRQLEAG